MKKVIFIHIIGALFFLMPSSCSDYPIDDNGLLITTKNQCYMSMFELFGPDHRSVLTGTAVIDTVDCVVTATAKFGTNLAHVKPYCGLVTDAVLEPAMGNWVDFTQPRKYTVVSGNRQVRKEYTITINLQGQ
jgi:hypothetical protein